MKKSFAEVLAIKNGRNQKAVENPDGPYPIYGSGGIIGRADDFICNSQTVIIGRKGTINNPIFVNEPFWNVDTAFGLEANKDIVYPKYLFYFCKSYDFESLNTTVTIPSLTKNNLLKIQMPIVSLDEQKKIATEFDKIQSAIDNKKQQLSLLDEAVKSEFVEMFGENPVESGKWKITTLGKIAEIGSSKRIFASEYVASGIPFYRSKEIIELSKNLKPSVELFISKERYEEIKNKNGVPEIGDILMTAVGTIGKFWEVNTDKPFYYKDGNLVYIRCKIFNSTFFRYILESLIEAFKQQNLVGSAYSALTIDRLKQMTVPMIELDLQNKFAAFVQQIDKSKFVVKKQIADLQELFDSKMQEYFGE
ncbi:MAG: restriction endonuclease subunit S [Treponema sp.]|nr:restriction endonuclease subunit S [Treponema sp.]